MKTLLILRHAKSDWGKPGMTDHDRPLNNRGKADAPRMGKLLREQGLTPDLILSSTAKRARHTAELAAEACGYEGEILFNRELYDTVPETIVDAINVMANGEDVVMVVGHNPTMEELVDVWTGESVTMTTGNIAQIELPIQSWLELREHTEGKLLNLWRPKEL
jgi:phosphohistidine phosphatase